MNLTVLERLVRLRRLACEDARRTLAACLRAEDEASAAMRSAEAAIRHEQEIACEPDADDAMVEAFAAWLPQGRQAVTAARAARARAEAATAQARAVVAAARASAEAAERLVQVQEAARAEAAGRREQALLDEIAARGTRPSQP